MMTESEPAKASSEAVEALAEGSSVRVEQVDKLHLPLVNRFYKQCRNGAKAGRGETVFVLKRTNTLLAAVRLVPKPGGYYFLRSMCVHPDYQRQGLGSKLLEGILSHPALDKCYCYPFGHLVEFYAQGGFVVSDHSIESEVALPGYMGEGCRRLKEQGRDVLLMVRLAD